MARPKGFAPCFSLPMIFCFAKNRNHAPPPPPRSYQNFKAVMEAFKRSVLDENGRVRRLSDGEAEQVAREAADGILEQVNQPAHLHV